MAPVPRDDVDEVSFPEMAYPSKRDTWSKSPYIWLEGKCMDDGADGLWRIHDKLYDFGEFVKRHPGGENWLTMTKGTDITEAFEAHHISTAPEAMLGKFYIRDATTKRNSPFTFKEDGFYKTLRRRVREEIKKLPDDLAEKSHRIIEGLTVAMFAFSVAACNASAVWQKAILCMFAGLFMSWTTNCGHNYLHQKNNWRMYLFNFSTLCTREFRISHVLSHHLYTNTLMDAEMSLFEPMFQWLPRKSKTRLAKYGPAIYGFFIYPFVFSFSVSNKFFASFTLSKKYSVLHIEDAVALILPATMYAFGKCSIGETLIVWVFIVLVASFIMTFINLHAAHHHPDVFHDGDAPKDDRDWGVHQLYAVMDRKEINGSLFRVLTNFGEHGLHHLFPAVDHAVLAEVHHVFVDTCKEFNTGLMMTDMLDAFLGSFRQMARTQCKKATR